MNQILPHFFSKRPVFSVKKLHLGLLWLTVAANLVCAATPKIQSGDSIAFMGDSITQQGAESKSGYVWLVVSGLAANGIKVTAIPGGKNGDTSYGILGRLPAILEQHPTWISLSSGVNDIWRSKDGQGSATLENYKKNIAATVKLADDAGAKVLMLTTTLVGEEPDGPRNILALDFNKYLRELALEKGYPLADLNVAMREDLKARKGTTQEHLTIDGVHMNYLGNLMMAKGVLRGFGLDDQQIAKAYDAWLDTPGAWPLTVTLNVSLRERETLRALAESQNKDLQAVLSQAFKTSVTPLLQSAQPPPGK